MNLTDSSEAGSNFFRIPADFLIAPRGVVVQAYYSDIVGEHLPFAAIEAYLAQSTQV